jgi:hypothetical protein
LRTFITSLPNYLNWQLDFFHAFAGRFDQALDVEKWWALRGVQFTNRDLSQNWSRNESCEKLATAIRTSVTLHQKTNALPVRSEATLQTVVTKWERSPQEQLLRGKLHELDLVVQRASPEVAELATAYHQAIESHLRMLAEYSLPRFQPKVVNREWQNLAIPGGARRADLSAIQKETVDRLNELDGRLSTLREGPEPIISSDTKAAQSSAPQ